jgi:hypothetical protein
MRAMHFDFQKFYAERRRGPGEGDLGGFWQKYRGPRRESLSASASASASGKIFSRAAQKSKCARQMFFKPQNGCGICIPHFTHEAAEKIFRRKIFAKKTIF